MQTSSDFDAKPMVMLLGQYSTGKTTFIKHLLGCDYPGKLLCLLELIAIQSIFNYVAISPFSSCYQELTLVQSQQQIGLWLQWYVDVS